MTSNYQLIKYRLLIPLLIKLVKLFRKDKNFAISEQPFFILGSGRNGSTLLASILNSNSNILIPPEQYVLPYSIMSWYLKKYSFENFIDFTLEELQKEHKTSNWIFNKDETKKAILSIDKEKRNLINIFDSLYRSYSKEEVLMWGDKTPLNTHFIKYVYDVFPKANFIVLLRDPRDVVLSYSKMPTHPASNPNYALWKWNDSIRTYDFLKKMNANVLLVKYEDLVSFTNEELSRISDFLNIKLNNQKNPDTLGVENQLHHQNLKKPISTASIGKWKNELSDETLKLIIKESAENLKRFNY